MMDRFWAVGVLLVPLARAAMQVRHLLGLLVRQVGAQHIAKEVVIAVPLAAVVERHEEQVGPVERFERGLASVLLGDGIAQRTRQTVQNRGVQQEFAHVVRLPLEHLLDQVVHDVAVVTCESFDEVRDVVATLHRERRQLECRDPAFGPPFEDAELVWREMQAHDVVEVRRRLVRREPQIGRADLDELAASAQTSQRQWRVGAAGNHYVHARRQTIEELR